MNPAVIFLPSRIVSLVSVSWTMRAITPSSKSRVIQSSWPSGPATNPSTVICTCSLSFRIVAISERPVRRSHLCVESASPKSTTKIKPCSRKRNIGVAFQRRGGYNTQHKGCISGTALYPIAEALTHGSPNPSARGHGEHRSDRKAGRTPRPTNARVARPHERGRVWHLVPGQTRWRVYRGQGGPGQAQHTGLRACHAGTAGRAHRPGALLLVSLASLRRGSRRGLLGRANDAGRVHARGYGRRHRPDDCRVRVRSHPARPSRRGVPDERERLDRADQAAREVCRVRGAPRRCSPRWATRPGSACWDGCRQAGRFPLLVSVKGPG